MKNLFYSIIALALFSVMIVTSCNKDINQLNAGCTLEISPAYLSFSLLEKNSGQDLFFSSSPKYSISDLIFFSKKDKSRKDTIRPSIVGTGTNRYFNVAVNNTVAQDTLLMKVASNPDDIIAYTIKKSDGTCPNYDLDKVYFNTIQLTSTQSKYIFNK